MVETLKADVQYDAGELGCGELAMALMKTTRDLKPGTLLEFRSSDSGAAADIPAWCNVTGNTLIAGPTGADGRSYFIRKKGL